MAARGLGQRILYAETVRDYDRVIIYYHIDGVFVFNDRIDSWKRYEDADDLKTKTGDKFLILPYFKPFDLIMGAKTMNDDYDFTIPKKSLCRDFLRVVFEKI